MKIAGLVKCSFVDYPGLLAAVVFTPGCNLRCVFCHNKGLVDADATCDWTQQEVLAWLKTRRGLLDAVVVSGGEPTLQPDILEFLARIHVMGFRTKLDTNGTRPDVLQAVIDAGSIDHVAMDIKGPLQKYAGICGAAVDLDAVNDSISMLLKGHIDYEFRTTVIPGLTRADILAVGDIIHGANAYVLQRFRQLLYSDTPRDACLEDQAPLWIEHVRQDLCHIVKRCILRGFDRRVFAECALTEISSTFPPL